MASTTPLLHGKTVMITGASSGIGAAAARAFAAEGAAVVLMARRADKLEHHARLIREDGGEALCVAGDVTDSGDVRHAVDRARDAYGGLDAAFNNAGWASSGTPLHKTPDDDYDRIMDVNVRGVWNCLRAQIAAMLETGTRGAIVNTSSVAGLRATGTAAPYIAAKHAVLGLTRAAADEYGPHGIRVNALVVGSTRTELMDEVLTRTPSLYEPFTGRAIQRRLADPSEVAQAALWLCSDRSSFTTGAAVAVDGGWTAR
ncbi:SDR family NAD(P)-dependent oxidoreductase [Streptomyces lavendofoliae]|uniref:2,5-dichloro-2,5-cyclohexadiene-1,4-diol dehydrogenase n=1 Tax=Streptomyces lavendofoliae TaxID=67314 RepID=A0A918HYD7_9ACTN|nr:glucose 1-dehydrogenase [Streptomyces lavendofoliae]GGU37946.1 2,5-dichloro-2,5-cyclohexadiene-1,4-diol dehydrogenase [Streptomyces lavendofoliae]